jgi:hypothetical protein
MSIRVAYDVQDLFNGIIEDRNPADASAWLSTDELAVLAAKLHSGYRAALSVWHGIQDSPPTAENWDAGQAAGALAGDLSYLVEA